MEKEKVEDVEKIAEEEEEENKAQELKEENRGRGTIRNAKKSRRVEKKISTHITEIYTPTPSVH